MKGLLLLLLLSKLDEGELPPTGGRASRKGFLYWLAIH
jgi:hypothetical protein